MTKYQAKPGSMVIGGFIMGAVEALGIYKNTGVHILSDVGISDLKPDQMYPMQSFCDFFEVVSSRIGPATLFMMGKNVAASFPISPSDNTVEKFLSGLDSQYKMSTKGLSVDEGWKVTKSGDNAASVVFTGHFPDDFMRGLIEGFLRRVSKSNKVMVRIDETRPRRDTGGKSLTLQASW